MSEVELLITGLLVAVVALSALARVLEIPFPIVLVPAAPRSGSSPGYAAYVPADALGVSGVLATVAAGIVMGIRGPRTLPVQARLQGFFVWDILDFVNNALLFVLIGLQLHGLLDSLTGYRPGTLLIDALAVAAAVTAVRLAWFFSVPYLIRVLDRRPAQHARRVNAAGSPPPSPPSPNSTSSPVRPGRASRPLSACATSMSTAPNGSPPAAAMVTTAVTRSRPRHTSAPCNGCSPPSATRSFTCATRTGSPTRR